MAKCGNPYSEQVQTHTVVNTHPEQWAASTAAPGEQLGVRCLAQESHLSRGIEGGENARYSLPPRTIPVEPEIRTHNLGLQVRRSIHKVSIALLPLYDMII